MPGLLRPPISAVLNRQHPLASSLCFLAAPGLSTRLDYAGNGLGVTLTSGSFDGTSKIGSALTSSSTSNGGAYWPFNPLLLSITTNFTVAVWANLRTIAAWSSFISIPFASAVWSPPYASIVLQQNNSTGQGSLSFAAAGNAHAAVSASGFMSTSDGLTLYGASRASGNVNWYRKGLLFSSNTGGDTSAVDWGSKRPVTLLNHSSDSNGEGIVGEVPLAMIFKRVLTDGEWLLLQNDPWGLLTAPLPVLRNQVLTLEQEGFRFRNDDGSETTATWLAGQDTAASIAAATAFRLRMLVNATGDPVSHGYKLQWKKASDGALAWRDVKP